MKNILFSILTICTLSCKAQIVEYPNIVPLEMRFEAIRTHQVYPLGTYFQDIHNLLDKFTGVWMGTANNKNYEFRIIKIQYEFMGNAFDRLVMRYKITNTNGSVVASTLAIATIDSPKIIRGDYINLPGNHYLMRYVGLDSKCGQNGSISLVSTSNPSQMRLTYLMDGRIEPDCTTGLVAQVIPEIIELTRQ